MSDKYTALFGPGGNSESFYAEGHKSTLEAPDWVISKGLDAYEYQGGNGITASEATLAKIGEKAKAAGVKMSLHTPYYISLSGVEEEKRLKSLDYIRKSLRAAELLVSTDDSVEEISRRLSFSSGAYFRKCFKAHFGLSPRALRKKHEI